MDEDKKVVVYDNRLNSASFSGLNAKDMDIFMAACVLAKDKGTEEVQIEYSALRQMTRFWNCNADDFHQQLKDLRDKMLHMTMFYETDDEVGGFVLFQTFRGNKKAKRLTLRASHDWAEILNGIEGNFTMFDLGIFIQLKSKHAKTLYRLLSQYRNKQGNGWWLVEITDFKRIFDIPDGYRGKDIIEKIVKPAVKECEKHFNTLTFEPIYARKRGKPLEKIRFEFTKAASKPKVERNVPTALPDQAKQENKTKQKAVNKNKFNDYSCQRNYTKEQYQDIEKKVLQASIVPGGQETPPQTEQDIEKRKAELLKELAELEKQK